MSRIRTERHVTAMAALDTVELLAQRVTNLLSHDRRMAMTNRYAYVNDPPELTVGLLLEDMRLWSQADAVGFTVRLRPGMLIGFGFVAYRHEGSGTEADAWKRYHACKADSASFFERRRSMTRVEITGGLPGDGPARDDRIVIQAWNGDGVCDERVIAFDTNLRATVETSDDMEQVYEEAAKALVGGFRVGSRNAADAYGYAAAPWLRAAVDATYARGASRGRRQAAEAIRAQAPATSVIEGGPDLMAWAADLAECPRCLLGVCSAHRPPGSVADPATALP